jgi:hypothetical protein
MAIELIIVFLKNYYKFVLFFILIGYAEYWHFKSIHYKNVILSMEQNSKMIESSLDQSIKEEERKKPNQVEALKKIQKAQVSNNPQEALDWIKNELVKNT